MKGCFKLTLTGWLALAGILFLFFLWIETGAAQALSIPPLRLPFFEGEEWWCAQGNSQGPTHTGDFCYAWDFNWGGGYDDEGKPVCAPAAGTVTVAGWCNRYSGRLGNVVVIHYDNSDAYGMFAHLEMVLVTVGEHVSASQAIGLCGGSGGWSPHIHYQTQDANWHSVTSSFVECGIPVTGGSYTSANSQLFCDAFNRNGGAATMGHPTDGIHWYFTYQPTTSEMNCYVQHYDGGSFGPAAIVYDALGGAHRAVVVRSGFWGTWRALGAGGPRSPLGQALNDEYGAGGVGRQDFLFGYLTWQNGHAHTTYYSDIGAASPGYGSNGHTHAFLDYYNDHGAGATLGHATNAFGGGAGVRRWGGMEIQYFSGGTNGDCAITYNLSRSSPGQMTCLLRGSNFQEYLARWYPGSSGDFIGPPYSDPFNAAGGRGLRQDFGDGYYMREEAGAVRVYASNDEPLDPNHLYVPDPVDVIDDGPYTCDPTFHFFWPVPAGSLDCYLQIATTPDFSNVEWEGWLNSTNGDKPYAGQSGRVYYGRVRVQGANGVVSPYGAHNAGVLVGCGVPCYDDGIFSNDPVVHFSYPVPDHIDLVHMQVATLSDFTVIDWESDLPASGDYAFSGSFDQTYYARVKLREDGGQWGEYGPPSDGIAIGITFPCYDSGDMTVEMPMRFQVDYVPGMVWFWYQVATDPLFSPAGIVVDSSFPFPFLDYFGQNSQTYYGRVRVLDGGGHWNGFGAASDGITVGATTVCWDEGEVSVCPNLVFHYQALEGASEVRIQVAHDPNFCDIVSEAETVPDGFWSLPGETNQTYYTRVKLRDMSTWGEYGPASDGITVGYTSATWDDGDYSADTTTVFSFDYPTGLDQAQIQIATDSAFTNVVQEEVVHSGGYVFNGEVDGIYYARVRGATAGWWSDFGPSSDGILLGSESWMADEGEVSPTRLITFSFDAYPGIKNSYCQVARDALFTDLVWEGWTNTINGDFFFNGHPGDRLFARMSLLDTNDTLSIQGRASDGILIQNQSPPVQPSSLQPLADPVQTPLVRNGGFEKGFSLWDWEDHLGQAEFLIDDTTAARGTHSALVLQSQSSPVYYQVQLKQMDFPLQQDQLYRLTFWAKTEGMRDISVTVMNDVSPWQDYGLWQTVNLTEEWTCFNLDFVSTVTATQDTRLAFLLGIEDAPVWLDGVSLRAISGT